jgi:hypothetical protein
MYLIHHQLHLSTKLKHAFCLSVVDKKCNVKLYRCIDEDLQLVKLFIAKIFMAFFHDLNAVVANGIILRKSIELCNHERNMYLHTSSF